MQSTEAILSQLREMQIQAVSQKQEKLEQIPNDMRAMHIWAERRSKFIGPIFEEISEFNDEITDIEGESIYNILQSFDAQDNLNQDLFSLKMENNVKLIIAFQLRIEKALGRINAEIKHLRRIEIQFTNDVVMSDSEKKSEWDKFCEKLLTAKTDLEEMSKNVSQLKNYYEKIKFGSGQVKLLNLVINKTNNFSVCLNAKKFIAEAYKKCEQASEWSGKIEKRIQTMLKTAALGLEKIKKLAQEAEIYLQMIEKIDKESEQHQSQLNESLVWCLKLSSKYVDYDNNQLVTAYLNSLYQQSEAYGEKITSLAAKLYQAKEILCTIKNLQEDYMNVDNASDDSQAEVGQFIEMNPSNT